MVATLRIMAAVGGAILCYASFFLYEKEEENVQNALESLWVRIDDLNRSAVSMHAAIVRVIAHAVTTVLDRVFGPRLISIQFVTVSGLLSLVSVLVVTRWLRDHLSVWLRPSITLGFDTRLKLAVAADLAYVHNRRLVLYVGLVIVVAVTAASITRHLRFLTTIVFMLLMLPIGWLAIRYSPTTYLMVLGAAVVPFYSTLIGILIDLSAITLTRRLLRWQVHVRSFKTSVALAAAQLLLAIGLILGPIIVGATAFRDSPGTVSKAAMIVMWSATSNLFAVVVAVLLTLALFTFAIHTILWSIIERPVYRVARLGIFRSHAIRMALFGLGLAMIMCAVGKPESIWRRLLALIGAA